VSAPAFPVTELDRWNATLVTREECDAAAGITDPATASARAAYEAAANGRQS
jgi:hypothetical protein